MSFSFIGICFIVIVVILIELFVLIYPRPLIDTINYLYDKNVFDIEIEKREQIEGGFSSVNMIIGFILLAFGIMTNNIIVIVGVIFLVLGFLNLALASYHSKRGKNDE